MKPIFSIFTLLGVCLLLISCREIDYGYMSPTPPVTVYQSNRHHHSYRQQALPNNSDAYYGAPEGAPDNSRYRHHHAAPSDSTATYGPPQPSSDGHYGMPDAPKKRERPHHPLPSNSTATYGPPQQSSNAHYGSPHAAIPPVSIDQAPASSSDAHYG